MMKVELKLKNVSPLFLGGANQQQPELRPASVRGALRFWLRAGLGGVIGDKEDLPRLHSLEAEVFGEAERGSTVNVRLSQPAFQPKIEQEPLLPHRNDHTAALTNALSVDVEFNLILALKPCAALKHLEIATWSALSWLTLGGLGRRSRRGAGSVRLVEVVFVPDELSPELKNCLNEATTAAASGEELAQRIGDLQDKALKAFAAYAPTNNPKLSSGLPSFSVLLPDTRIIVWTPPNTDLKDYETALKPLMNEMSSLKGSPDVDFDNAFGGIKPRRASPLIVTAHQLQDSWALVLTYLKAQIRNGNNGKPQHVENWLDQLINRIPQEAFDCEVQGGTDDE